jgi:hypothetical protein
MMRDTASTHLRENGATMTQDKGMRWRIRSSALYNACPKTQCSSATFSMRPARGFRDLKV